MNEWQPIETAPKDGTRVLGYFPNLQAGICDTYYIERHRLWASREYPVQPTHWLPLPDSPK